MKNMKTVLVTGSSGFIGKTLIEWLSRLDDINVLMFDKEDSIDNLQCIINKCDFIFHTAGVNRPIRVDEFNSINVGFTDRIIDCIKTSARKIPIAFTSSIQAKMDNPYGISKKNAEEHLINFNAETNNPVFIYRFPNIFGKWCRPNYNSVVATFCYNISHNMEITISDENKMLELAYIDDVMKSFINLLSIENSNKEYEYISIDKTFRITIGELADKIYKIKKNRENLIMPDLKDKFMKYLYATYLSYLDDDKFAYSLEMKNDNRGWLTELIKSENAGQIFVSKSYSGVIRGNHYHDTKVEKFCLIQGKAVIKFRSILNNEIIKYYVSDERIEIVDIPPGYTHAIENVGNNEMIVLFWVDEIFNLNEPDTYYMGVEI